MNTSKIALYTNPDEVLTLTPSESIISMFEHTDENGTLYIPEWPYDGNCDNTEHFYQCAMNWSENATENVVSEYRFLYAALEEIAKKWDSINSDSDIEKLSPNLRDVWNTFLRDFETGGIDVELAMDISDRSVALDSLHKAP